MKITANFDGAITYNPGGLASYGFIVFKDKEILARKNSTIGSGKDFSCNVAEYVGFIKLMEFFIENKFEDFDIDVFSDSQLLVKQMNGELGAKKGSYKKYYFIAKEMLKKFYNLKIEWVRREDNYLADEISRPSRP